MRKLALALAAAAALGFAAPTFVGQASAAQGVKVAAADMNVKAKRGHRYGVKKVTVRRDRGLHRGWAHSRHYGATKKVVIKRGGHRHGTVVKKKIIHRG
jgi:hypothetical protein